MSRIGRLPIPVPSGVTVTLDGPSITVKGPRGELHRDLHPDMLVAQEESLFQHAQSVAAEFGLELYLLHKILAVSALAVRVDADGSPPCAENCHA